ncbi:hypothetical protein SAMN04487996_112242 [Dyadobacter soli]|uniref:SPW repeat-containing protein n=1 Tax=Dyadobacter soli TaxID=659014 RepID=A0A1G7P4S3_9BACT|nr:hypothetical protein [Dyadobacter soli]SDF80599.1 hypothetical protein SAMN04487996_112242 [Dyadobacter soli]
MKTLKNVMLINAISSGATGLGLAIFPKAIAGLFETTATMPFIEVGIFLVAFAALVFSVSRGNPMNARAVRLVIVLDTLWVIGSAAIVLFQPFPISVIGYVGIGAVALWVAAMAYLQSAGLRQMSVSK